MTEGLRGEVTGFRPWSLRLDSRRVDGTNSGAFDRGDWLLALTTASLWGTSFLWIAMGLDSLTPGLVAFGRVALGAGALWLLPSARRPVPRALWPAIIVVGVAGNGGPALLYSLAQQSVDSSVAAMVNSATPIAVLLVGIVLARRSPGRRQIAGIVIGLVGVLAIAAPSLVGSEAEPGGVALLGMAVLGYGVSNNVVVAAQQRVGAVPVLARALTVASLFLAPLGLVDLARLAAAGRASDVTPASVLAVVILGVGCTGVARSLSATLVGRTGAARGSIVTYLVPIIAVALGVTIRHEAVEPVQIAGTVVVLAGAWLTTRASTRARNRVPDRGATDPVGSG